MQEKPGFWSHFGGIIRFVIFILLVITLTFFAVRWIRDRQTTETNRQQTQTEQRDQRSGQPAQPSNRDANGSRQDGDTPVQSEDTQTDQASGEGVGRELSTERPASVPSTGPESVFMTLLMLSTITYLLLKKRGYRPTL